MNDFFSWCGKEISRDSFAGYLITLLAVMAAFMTILVLGFIVAVAAQGTWKPLAIVVAIVLSYIYLTYKSSGDDEL